MAKLKAGQTLRQAQKHERNGEIDKARGLYKSVLETFPKNAQAHKALVRLGRTATNADVTALPPEAEVKSLLELYQSGNHAKLIEQASTLVQQYPASSDLWAMLGASHRKIGQLEAAEKAFVRAAKANPNAPDVHKNLSVTLIELGKFEEALPVYQTLIRLDPDDAECYNNMGFVLRKLGKLDDALIMFNQALTIEPNNASVQNNIGSVWLEKKNLNAAEGAFLKALQLRSKYPQALNNLGLTYHDQGQFGKAITCFRNAIALNAEFSRAYANLGDALAIVGKIDEAVSAYKQAFTINPEAGDAECAMLYQMLHACDWSAHEHMSSTVRRYGIETKPVSPFALLAMEDHPDRQRQRSQAVVQSRIRAVRTQAKTRQPVQKSRLRVGYFGADFRDHPCLYLLMGMLRCHDTSRFEIFAFSYGDAKSGNLRARAKATVDQFHDVADMDDETLVSFAQKQELDIAIDLMGHTRDTRMSLFENRLAPVHVSFVGFPGTTGADFMDYLVGDPTVIPDEHRLAYTEHILYMPHTYLPNDNTLAISNTPTRRTDFGLPDDAFVLCCFNNNYKIGPREFDIWMRVMHQIDNSVLWMLRTNRYSVDNLRREAQARGIDPSRLIVGERLPHPEHMARHKHADLFVDTFNYNAHTTASEALWAGLPIVTKRGEQFAARVAASMLTSIGLPELVTTTEADYEALILELATDRDQLRRVKEKLADNRLTQPFFNTEKFTQDFENGLRQAYDLWASGAPPRDIRCAEQVS